MKKMTSKAMVAANGGFVYKRWYDFTLFIPGVNLITGTIICVTNGINNGRTGTYN